MLKNNKSVGRLIGGCYTKYIRYISSVAVYNDVLYINTSFPLLQDSHLTCFRGQRRNLCIQTKSTPTTIVNFGKRVLSKMCSKFLDPHSAMTAPLATALCGTYDYRDEGKEVKKQENKREELTSVKAGDILDLRELLFTKNRDYLIKNNGNQVKAEQLAGKEVVIFFVSVPLDYVGLSLREKWDIAILKDVYNYLPPNKGFEVVFVAVNDVDTSYQEEMLLDPSPETKLENHFKDVFSCMPWTAIPFSDKKTRRCLQSRFGFRNSARDVNAFVIDSTGVVLHNHFTLICSERYGSLGYPFGWEWLNKLDSEYKAIASRPTLGKLLSSPERDYVISNNGAKVPIHSLEDKVVALYFYEPTKTDMHRLTEELKKAYAELAGKFEVVLLYLYDTFDTFGHTNEESFWKTFKTMPWLALPYKDPNLKKLESIYEYPRNDHRVDEQVPMLVIIGPHGEFCEPCGADILLNFNFPGYPFTREKALMLETERIKKLKFEMLWLPNTVFSGKAGFQVSLSQLAGKRIILLFGVFRDEFLKLLEKKYLDMKGTDGEFEVINIYIPGSPGLDLDLPWLTYPLQGDYLHASDFLSSDFHKVYSKRGEIYDLGAKTRLLAFDRDGMVVRDTVFPTIESVDFPFYTMGMEKEALFELDYVFRWYHWEPTKSYNARAGYVGPNRCCGHQRIRYRDWINRVSYNNES